MGFFFRVLLLASLCWVGYILYTEASAEAHKEDANDTKVIALFAGCMLDGAAVGLMLTLFIVPAIGQHVGSFFFNPGEEMEHDAHADAISKLAQGDPEGAISVYEDILGKDPTDTLAISEIAKICCRDLGDTARGLAVIERALSSEWPQEQTSFLANRLVDIYLLQGESLRAREVLIHLAENLDGTKYAANAQHRLHEIDRSMEANAHTTALLSKASDAPAGGEDAAVPEGEEPPSA